MAKFLHTSATNYYLEELIKSTSEKLVLISPFLKLNKRIKELLEDKNRLKIDIRIIYGKSELKNDEINWLKELEYIRTSFCENLHAKCYMNEKTSIVTSMNLYEFSQINNNEMGILINKEEDKELYRENKEEVERIIRISDEVRISVEKIISNSTKTNNEIKKISTSKLALKLKLKTEELHKKLLFLGYLKVIDNEEQLTDKAKEIGGEEKKNRYTKYFVWNENTIF